MASVKKVQLLKQLMNSPSYIIIILFYFAGFGVCCLFTTSTCGGSTSNNITYITNPGFPATYNTAGNRKTKKGSDRKHSE